MSRASTTRRSTARRSTARRRALRAAVIAAPLVALSAVPAAALAGPVDDTPGTDHPLGVVNSLLIFLVAPVGVFLVVAVLTLRPGSAPKAQRYRPGKDWSAAPSWTGLQPTREVSVQAPFAGDGEPVTLPSGGGDARVPVMDGAPHQEHADTQADHDAAARGDEGPSDAPATEPTAAESMPETPAAESMPETPAAESMPETPAAETPAAETPAAEPPTVGDATSPPSSGGARGSW